AWSSALRLAGLEIVRRRTPSAGRSVRTSPLMQRKSSGRRPRRRRTAARAYSRTTSVSPSLTACPSSQRISFTTPGSSASTGISIFIDSRMTTVSPSAICSPTWHSIFQTVPVMCASTSGTTSSSWGARTIAAPVDGARPRQVRDRAQSGGYSGRRGRRARRPAGAGEPSRPDADPGAGVPRPPPGGGLRPLPRARPDPRAGPDVRGRPRGHLALLVDRVPRARHRARARAGDRAGDPRAEPLVVHGPLLPRGVDPPQGVVHGEVAALQAAAVVRL